MLESAQAFIVDCIAASDRVEEVMGPLFPRKRLGEGEYDFTASV